MSHLTEAVTAMKTLHDLCLSFGRGIPPDGYSVLGIVNDLVYLNGKIAEEQAQKFGGSQHKKLTRKIEEAKQHRSFREMKKTMAECDKEAMLAVGEEYKTEIDAMEEYELYVAMMRAIQEAVRFGISVNSTVRQQESQS